MICFVVVVILAGFCTPDVEGIFRLGALHGVKQALSKSILGVKWDKVKWSAGINGSAHLSLNATVPLTSQIDNVARPKRRIMCNSIEGKITSGRVYQFPVNGNSYKVYCEMTNAGKWTLFQHRVLNRMIFHYKKWSEYKAGFGQAGQTDYWLGNEVLHQITKQRKCRLRVEIRDAKRKSYFAEYSKFGIASEQEGYRLTVGDYRGNAGDGLTRHNGMKFSTRDKDNDLISGNCAVERNGAWWYKDCNQQSNLNARYSLRVADDDCYHWTPLYKNHACLKSSKMMFLCF